MIHQGSFANLKATLGSDAAPVKTKVYAFFLIETRQKLVNYLFILRVGRDTRAMAVGLVEANPDDLVGAGAAPPKREKGRVSRWPGLVCDPEDRTSRLQHTTHPPLRSEPITWLRV